MDHSTKEPTKESTQEQRRVLVTNGDMQAEQVCSFLQAAGIKTAVRGNSFRKLFDISEGESGAVEIFVAPADEKRARALLRSAEAGEFRLKDDDAAEETSA